MMVMESGKEYLMPQFLVITDVGTFTQKKRQR
jgi:hypothetical protein